MTQSSIPHNLIPAGYFGPVHLPGTGRVVFWTGRIAIGIRYKQPALTREPSESESWIQQQLLADDAQRRLAS
jgi:hypothetical protein